jgi:ankyrin repeat protein
VLPIHAAARGGYLDIAKQLVAAGSAVNDDGCHGRTPLYLATAINDRALVEFFLQAGADVNLGRDKPVAAAVENGIRGIGILKLLIAAGADVNLQSGLLSTGPNPQYEGVVKILLEAGIDVNGSRHQWTGLATAAAQGAGKIVKLLLEAGADPNLAAEPGASPPLRWAAARGHPGVVKLLIDAGAEIEGQGLMVAAARSKNFTVLRILLDAGVPVDDVDRLNYTALREASDNGAEDVVRLLLDRGADTNCAPVWRNPLYAALKKGHPGVVKMLIDAGADTTLPSAREGNALQVAAQWGYPKIIKILSAAGVTADPGVDYYERARQREDERAREDR